MLAASALRRLIKKGHLTIIGVDGRSHEIKGPEPGARAVIRLLDRSLHRRMLFYPQLALGEAYTDGTLVIEEGTLYDLLEIGIANLRRIDGSLLQRAAGLWRGIQAAARAYNPVHLAQPKVAHHYDLRGELFDLFLDSDRQYSCAYFANPNEDLETAQRRKKLHIAAKLLLEPGQRVLDIGSGWGGLGLFLARVANVEVDGVTLSREQLKVSNERAWKRRLSERVRFNLKDYRKVNDRYDRIVSVGMLEHVGPRHYVEYYRQIARLLTDEGVALIHSIGKFHAPGPQNPWIDRYIFPGAYTPTLSEQLPHIERAGLYITDVEILRSHYAATLRRWREAYVHNLDTVRNMYDERFCRMWDFYLIACELAFRHGLLMVFQIQLSKSLDTVPQTRDYIAAFEQAHAEETTMPRQMREL